MFKARGRSESIKKIRYLTVSSGHLKASRGGGRVIGSLLSLDCDMTTVLVLLLLTGAILPKTASKERQIGAAGVLGSLLPPNYDKMTAPPHVEGEKAEILVDLEVLGIPRLDEVVCKRTVLGQE